MHGSQLRIPTSESRQRVQEPRRHITLVIGNPGTGKSAILNSLTESANFKSGVSIGSGVTQQLQIYKQTAEKWFVDTPGFDDVEIREKAAAEIEKALKLNADYSICFVVTLESGRLRPTDLSTMQVVLEAIKLPNNAPVKYGLVVNKLEEEVLELFEDPEHVKFFCGQLNLNGDGQFVTDSIFLCKFDPDLYGKSNRVPEKNEELEMFMTLLPKNVIKESNVQPIEYDKAEKLRKEYEDQTQRLLKESDYLKEQLSAFTKNAKKFEGSLPRLEEENSRLKEQYVNRQNMENSRGKQSKQNKRWVELGNCIVEIADGLGMMKVASSIWRFGVTFYEILSPDPEDEDP